MTIDSIHRKQPAVLIALALLTFSHSAHAGGMFLAPQGVRPLARGGALVAGADDHNALTYNPAAITEAPNGLMGDLVYPLHTTTYQRTITEGDTGGYGSVQGKGLGLPIPNLGAIHDFHWIKGLRFGVGLAAPNPLLQNWPDSINVDPPAAQRYAIENYKGTAIAKLSAGAGYAITDWLSIGATFQLLAGNFASQVRASACDGAICTQAENPAYDNIIQLRATMIMVPGAQVGVLIKPFSWLRIGASWESMYKINHKADFRFRLPSADIYQGAQLSDDNPKGKVAFTLPQVARLGVEARWKELLRVETAVVWENWSAHQNIDIDLGNTKITHINGLQDYELAPVSIRRGFRDTYSIRLGTELFPMIHKERPLALRAGLMYEPSAIPASTLTPMSVDLNKFILGVGVAYTFTKSFIGKPIVIEVTYAHVFMRDRTVTNSQIYQTNPTRPEWSGRTAIGNGTYSAHADLFGAGMRLLL